MWVLLALGAALCQATGDTLNKRFMKSASDYELSIGIFLLSASVLIPVAYFQGSLHVTTEFWIPFVAVCVLDMAGLYCYLRAIRSSDLSLTLPFQMFTPLFLLMTSPIMVGEYPSTFGLFGVLLIVIGSYVINSKSFSQDLLEPFRALIEQPGPRFMCIGAFIWSLTCNLHKTCTLASSPLGYAALHRLGMLILLLALGRYFFSRSAGTSASESLSLRRMLRYWPLALCFGLTVVLQLSALTDGLVVYVTSVKRVSVLFGICLGVLIFKELGFRQRFAGATIMTMGVFFTAM